jgi:Zn-dependent metalloprotease
MKVLTVKQAVVRVNNGQDLEGIVLHEDSIQQVNVRDAMVLSRGGIVIPEQNIYYDDNDIQYDEDIDELTITSGVVELSWAEKARKASAQQQPGHPAAAVKVDLSTQEPEIDNWLLKNEERVAALLKPIIVGLFEAEKKIEAEQK